MQSLSVIQCLPSHAAAALHRAQLDLGPFRLSRLLQHGGCPSRTTRRAHRSGHLPAGPCRTESFLRRAVPRTRAKYREPHNRFVPARPPRPKSGPERCPSPRPPCAVPQSRDGMMTSVTLQGWLLLSLFFPSLPLGEWEARRRAGDWIGVGGPRRAAPLGQPCERVSQGRSAFPSLGSGGFGHFFALFWERQGAAGRGRFRLNAVARCHGAESLCTACTACHHILYVRFIVHNGNVLLCTRAACLASRVFCFRARWEGDEGLFLEGVAALSYCYCCCSC
jgi:hypothetical protein